MKRYELIEKKEGNTTVVTTGTLKDIIRYINGNPNIWDWTLDEDPDGYKVPEIDLDADIDEVNRHIDYGISWCQLVVQGEGLATIERAAKIDEYRNVLPNISIGGTYPLDDVWDGEGPAPMDSYSYQLNDTTWINYSFDVLDDGNIVITGIDII